MYFIGADLGTSSLKLLLVNSTGEILRSISKPYPVSYPKSGWSEQAPDDWWNAFKIGIRELLQEIDSSKVRGIAVAGQMHGLVILDKDDQIIRPAILWNDGRTSEETDYLNETIGQNHLSSYTSNIAFAGFTAPKLLWLKKHEPKNFDRIFKIMLPKDYINYRLTGIHSTDYSDASGMLLLDVKNKCWSKQMLEICEISEDQLPQLYESYEKIGTVLPEVAKELGLSSEVFVAAGAGDNAGAAIGTGTIGEGRCNISLGTSGTIFISSKNFCMNHNHALHSFCHADGNFHLMGCMLSAASCNQWFCEEILKTTEYAAEQKRILDDMLGKNTVYFLPYLMGERSPINDTNASGVFLGLRPNTKREDVLLAVLEGVAFAVRDNLEIAKELNIPITESTVCGGGGKSPLWLKILCNVLNMKLMIPKTEEGPGYGAAHLAMVACGEYKNIQECVHTEIKSVIEPIPELAQQYDKKYENFKRIYPALKNLFKEIKE